MLRNLTERPPEAGCRGRTLWKVKLKSPRRRKPCPSQQELSNVGWGNSQHLPSRKLPPRGHEDVSKCPILDILILKYDLLLIRYSNLAGHRILPGHRAEQITV